MRSKTASSPWISAASKFPSASFSIAKKFSAICLASRGKFKYAAARKNLPATAVNSIWRILLRALCVRFFDETFILVFA